VNTLDQPRIGIDERAAVRVKTGRCFAQFHIRQPLSTELSELFRRSAERLFVSRDVLVDVSTRQSVVHKLLRNFRARRAFAGSFQNLFTPLG
jgi:hypothetical protein